MRAIQGRYPPLVGLALLLLAVSAPAQKESPQPWKAPGYAARKKNPVAKTPVSLKIGKLFFTSLCSSCHGNGGKGDGPAAAALDPKPRDLTQGDWHLQTDGALFWKIRTGRAPMPVFAATMTEEQTWQVIQFLRTLLPTKSAAPERLSKYAGTVESRRRVSAGLVRYFELVDVVRKRQLNKLPGVRSQLKLVAAQMLRPGIEIKGAALEQWQRKAKALAAALDEPPENEYSELHALTEVMVGLLDDFAHGEKASVWLLGWKRARNGAGGKWLQMSADPDNPFGGGQIRKEGEAAGVFPVASKKSPKKQEGGL